MHTLLLVVGLWLSWVLLKVARPFVHRRSGAIRIAYGHALLSLLPASALTLSLGTFLMVDQECFGHSARWDQTASLLASGAVMVYFGLTVARGLERRVRLARFVKGLPYSHDPRLALAIRHLGGSSTGVRVLPLGRPAAFLIGWRIPEIVLSDWMLESLDEAELEAVVAHELAHARRGDTVLSGLSSLWARFFPLASLRRLQALVMAEIELAADALAIRQTGRPLALASALAKFWKFGSGPDFALAGVAQLAGPERLEHRIAHLMNVPTASGSGVQALALSPTDLGRRWHHPPAQDLSWSLLAAALAWATVIALLGIAPSWVMTRDHQLFCKIELPS